MKNLINSNTTRIITSHQIITKKAADLAVINSQHNNTPNYKKGYFDKSLSKNKKILRSGLLGRGLFIAAVTIVKWKSISKIFSNFFKKSNKNDISEKTDKILPKTEKQVDTTPTELQLPPENDIKKAESELRPKDEAENNENISVIPPLPEKFESLSEKRKYYYSVKLNAGKNEASLIDAINIIKKVGFEEFFDIKDSTPFRFKHNIKIFDDWIVNKKMSPDMLEDYIKCFDNYVKIRPEEVTENVVKEVFYPWDRENLQSAINSIKDEQQKRKMQDLFNQRIAYLFSTPMRQNTQEILALMKKYFYRKSYLSEEEKKQITEKFAENKALAYIANSANPISEESAIKIARMIFSLKPEDFNFCKNNLDKIIMLNKTGSFIGNSDQQCLPGSSIKLIVNSIKTFFEKDKANEYLEDISAYVGYGNYDTINGVLRFKIKLNEILANFTEKKSTNSLKDDMDELSAITKKIFNLGEAPEENQMTLKSQIDSIKDDIEADKTKEIYQKLNKLKNTLEKMYAGTEIEQHTNNLKELLDVNMTELGSAILTRGDSLDIFRQLSLNNKKLSELMKDKNEAENVVKFLNETKPTLTLNGFTSTSLEQFCPYKSYIVYWSLTPGKTVKGMYINDIDNLFEKSNGNYNGSEAEVLLMPNAKIKIERVEYIENEYGARQYKISGTISHDNQDDSLTRD